MQKQKENIFNNKFHLLSSQQSQEQDIYWSSSDSSEYENAKYNDTNNLTNKNQNRKRKRCKKVPKNISNLDIIINDKEHLITGKNQLLQTDSSTRKVSPILSNTQHYHNRSDLASTSPILPAKTNKDQLLKSPIIVLKSATSFSPKVRKKLFDNDNVGNMKVIKSKSVGVNDIDNSLDSNIFRSRSICHMENTISEENNNNLQQKRKPIDNLVISKTINKYSKYELENIMKIDDSMELLKPNKLDLNLVKKVTSYFESNFSSESASQYSINDTPTPKNSSKTSDDIEITSTNTQIPSNKNSTESFTDGITKDENFNCNAKSKKIRYKKDGLAYRLSALLKKHNANISLWQHERFLAANSNFVLPKEEHLTFRIKTVNIKYGCFLLEAKNIESENFLILINKMYVTNNCNISKDVILKVYEPYKILNFNEFYKLIINVCKFESLAIENT